MFLKSAVRLDQRLCVVDFKNVRFHSSTRIHQTRSDTKRSNLESCYKIRHFRYEDSLVSCGRKVNLYKKVRDLKNIQIRVDGT